MRWGAALAVSYLAAAGSAETLNLGKLDQYKPKDDVKVPKLDGDTLWFSGGIGDMNVALSQKTQDSAKAALEKCPKGKADNDCYQRVYGALMGSNVEMDPHGDRRRFVPLFVALIGVVAAHMVTMWALYKEPKLQPVYFVPGDKASEPPKFGQPLSITADGASMVVVTPTPQAAPTKTKGSDVHLTELPKPSNDAHYAASIGDDLAKPLKDFINSNKECSSGKNYKRDIQARGSDLLDMASCAAQAVVAAAAPGGQFRELQFLGQGDEHLQVNPDNKDLAGAVRDFAQFVKDYAPMLGLTDPAVLDQFGLAVFLIVYESILEPAVMGAVIPIKDSLLSKMQSSPTKTSAPTASSSASGCPDPKKKTLLCAYGLDTGVKNDCDAQSDKKAVCDSGEYKDCACSMPPPDYIAYESNDIDQFIIEIAKTAGSSGGDNKPKCSGNLITSTPPNFFSSNDNKVYKQFCEKWSKGSKLEWTTNVYGSPTDGAPLKPKDGCQGKDSLDCDPFKYYLKYEPKDSKQNCDCNKAFESLATCVVPSNGKRYMNHDGNIDAGCGTFSYQIGPEGWPERQQKCFGLGGDKYASRSDIEDAVKNKYCKEDAVQKGQLDKNSGSISRTYNENTPGAFAVSIDFHPGEKFSFSYDDCVANLLGKCADDCDVPSKDSNPMNWKGGGEYIIGDNKVKGYVRYSITPLNKRKPAPNSPQGHCHVDYKFGMLYNGVEIWGAGWESTDGGSSLKQQLKGCALFPAPGFKLVYEQTLDDKDKHGDGREWTAYFRTGIGQRKCTGHAIGSAGGFDWGCSGGGA